MTTIPFSMESVVVGRSAKMRAVFEFVRVIAPSDTTVLITGETGTGKEIIAQMLHASSPRRHGPFVAVSCALFSETLVESELFGHERGAFTGAIKERLGRFELADGGTVFLDDIDDIPPPIQVKLLRVLQNRTLERVGGTRSIPVNVRVIAGSKRNLRMLVKEGTFRQDLYYRVSVLPILLPPLRERREDVPVFVDHFLRKACRRQRLDPPPLSAAVLDAFMRYDWPGNVRELENACERIAQTCTCGTVRAGCVAARILFHSNGRASAAVAPAALPTHERHIPAGAISLDDRLRRVEADLIQWALRTSGGNKSKAAGLLAIKRSTLLDRIKRCGLEPAHRDPDSQAATETIAEESLAS